MSFKYLLGREFLFYGVDYPYVRLDETVYILSERNIAESRLLMASPILGSFSYGPLAIIQVIVEKDPRLTGFEFVDVEYNHSWLKFGFTNIRKLVYFEYVQMSPNLRTLRVKSEEFPAPDCFDRLFSPRES